MRISKNRIDLEGARLDNAVIKDSTLSGTTAATQAEQETGTSTTVAVTPGRQHFNPGHPKCWAFVTVSGGTQTLQVSYNITSITDGGAGITTFTIAVDFSSANWCALAMSSATPSVGVGNIASSEDATHAAGSIVINTLNGAATKVDPESINFAGLGDQA